MSTLLHTTIDFPALQEGRDNFGAAIVDTLELTVEANRQGRSCLTLR